MALHSCICITRIGLFVIKAFSVSYKLSTIEQYPETTKWVGGYAVVVRCGDTGTPLGSDRADGLFDHIDHDVRESDGDGVRRFQLNDVSVCALGLELKFCLGNDGI